MSEPSVDLVSAALVAAQGAVKAAEFDATNPFFKSRYATLGSVIEASREALLTNGLAILQRPTIVDSLVSVQTTIIHKSGQTLDGGVMSLKMEENDRNSDAQVAGSILTYLKRYAWASVLGIYADEDNDGNDAPKSKKPPVTTQLATTSKTGKPILIDEKYRMITLNRLKAAPGQEHRGLLEGYLRSKLWISGDQTADSFPLNQLPQNDQDFKELSEAILRFDITQREQAQP